MMAHYREKDETASSNVFAFRARLHARTDPTLRFVTINGACSTVGHSVFLTAAVSRGGGGGGFLGGEQTDREREGLI